MLAGLAVWGYLYDHRKEIIIVLTALVFFILWFTLERMSDKIDRLNAELETKNAEIAVLHEEMALVIKDTETVKQYIKTINTITNNEKQELDTNEAVCMDAGDFDSIIPRLNELFGHCSE